MRPLELYLEGFTSFRGEQRLDFSELDLFAITGATGAGKSSLLDAMTYALYGTTTRTGKQVSELVSQGSKNLKVQLRFKVAEREYRVTRKWRYRPSTPVTEVLLEGWQDNTWETLSSSSAALQKTIEQIVGMDFDTFTRVILLPQGEFDEFLKGDKAKRREILRQLAGFEIFERMRSEASELSRVLAKEVEALERQRNDLQAPSLEEVEEKRSSLAAIEAELPLLNEAVLKAQEALKAEEVLFSQLIRLRELQEKLGALNGKSAEIAALEARLMRSRSASQLQGDWARVTAARQLHATASRDAAEAEKGFNLAQQQLEKEGAKFEQVRARQEAIAPQFKAREEALATAKVYAQQHEQIAREVERLQAISQQKAAERDRAVRDFDAATAKVTAAEKNLQAVSQALSQHKPGGERLAVLNEIAPLLVEWKLISTQLKKNSDALQLTAAQLKTSTQNRHAIAAKLEAAEVALKTARAALELAELKNAEAARSEHAAALRASLKSGDTCPVCGGIHPESDRLPPLPPSALVEIAPLRDREVSAASECAAISTELTKAEAALEALRSKELDCRQEFENTQNRLGALIAQVGKISGNPKPNGEELERERQALARSDSQYQKALTEQKEAAADLEKAQQALDFAKQTRDRAREQHLDAIASLERQQLQLQEISAKLHELTGGKSYAKLSQALEEEKQALVKELQAAEKSYQQAREQAIQAEERYKQAGTAVIDAAEKKEQLNASWSRALEAADFTEETFLTAAATAAEQAAWQEEIGEYAQAKVRLETLVKEIGDFIQERTTDERAIALRRETLQSAKMNCDRANQTKTDLSAWLQVAEQKLQQAEDLAEREGELKASQETYHTLAQNLKTNEFQAYLLEHLETELVERATLLLRELTDSRYALCAEDGDYWVEDNWNGGEKRRVRTLSGGETFATSLSMALALSEKLSMGAHLGSLFLDEGFGTLDAETLESVTQILEALRQRSRMIGVITHVRSLGERLPAQVKVYKSPAGSRLEVEMV